MNKGHAPIVVPRPIYRQMAQSIERADLPDGPVMGPEIFFESKRRVSALIRKTFHEAGIEHVSVSCPDEVDYILIRLPEVTDIPMYRAETSRLWHERVDLYEKLDTIIRMAYPNLTEPEIRFGTDQEWQKQQRFAKRHWPRAGIMGKERDEQHNRVRKLQGRQRTAY